MHLAHGATACLSKLHVVLWTERHPFDILKILMYSDLLLSLIFGKLLSKNQYKSNASCSWSPYTSESKKCSAFADRRADIPLHSNNYSRANKDDIENH
jgi:hypothetical protein